MIFSKSPIRNGILPKTYIKEERNQLGNKGIGYGFYAWLIKNNFPPGYRILCKKCNSKEYKRKLHLIVPKRFIYENRDNPKVLEEYREYLKHI